MFRAVRIQRQADLSSSNSEVAYSDDAGKSFLMEAMSRQIGPAIDVVTDDREAGSDVVQALTGMEGVRVRMERLKTGDYFVDGRCLFERKTVADFASSIIDGRLFAQAQRLVQSQLPCALLLEGTSRDLEATGMRREALQGAVISISLIYQIPLLRSLNSQETARLMIYAANQLRRDVADAIPLARRRPKRRLRIQLGLLQALPGIGPARAKDLLQHFGSVVAILTASCQELEEVKGVGEETARKIRWALEPRP